MLAKSILDLPPDEEIYIDITHGLRHHQTMMASTLGFINKLSPNANRNLHLLYGAFQQGEDNTTPILNLDAIDSMHQWSEALNAFIGHGDYEILAGKIRKLPQQSAKQLANFLEKLSFEIAGNYVFTRKDGTMGTLNITLEQTKKQIEKFEIEAKQVGKNGETIAALLIFSQLKSWMEPFLQQKDSVQLLMTLAKDHLKRHRYLLALTSCYEGLRQYQSKVAGIRLTGNDDQEKRYKQSLVIDFKRLQIEALKSIFLSFVQIE